MEVLARYWEQVVVPQWEARLVPGLVEAMVLPKTGSVLVARCRTGYAAQLLVERLPDAVRCMAIDANRDMLDIARNRLLPEGRRIWWESREVDPLPYQDDVFGASICASGLTTKDDLHRVGRELARVTTSGGHVGMVVSMSNTFQAFYDLLREAMLRHGLVHLEPELNAFVDNLIDPDALRFNLGAAGVRDVQMRVQSWPVSFENGARLWNDRLIASLFMPSWAKICPDRELRDQLFEYIASALDTYFHGYKIELEVCAAWVIGRV